MATLRISELAERAGVPSSTLRYYERIGLLEPVGRGGNGYRIYDETSLERLAFVSRAKRLGMCLDDVATLVEVWFAGDCGPAQDQLRVFLTSRISELRRRIADDSAFERQLERLLARLRDVGVPERCGPDCGCDAVGIDEPGVGSMACSLSGAEVGRRLEEWRQLLGEARVLEREGPVLRAVFGHSAAMAADLARLCSAETVCCPFLAFNVDIARSSIVLRVSAPEGGANMTAGFFDSICTAPSVAG